MPRVSVLLPSTNAKDALMATVDSILGQGFSDFELVIVDDGSTDGTGLEVLKRLGPNPARAEQVWWDSFREDAGTRSVVMVRSGVSIHYFHHAAARGRCTARNRAVTLAKGAILAFAEAGDIWGGRKLATQMQLLDEQPNLSALLEPASSNGARRPSRRRMTLKTLSFDDLLQCATIPLSGSIVLRTCIDHEIPFDENLLECEEFDFWLRVGCRFTIARMSESLQSRNGAGGPVELGLEPFRVYALEKSYQGGHLTPGLRHRVALELAEECERLVSGYRRQDNRERAAFYDRKCNRIRAEVAKLELSDPFISAVGHAPAS